MSAVASDAAPILREMRESDLRSVLVIENIVYDFPWSKNIFRDCLKNGYVCRTYEQDTQILGYGIMSVGIGECHLLNICIRPQSQSNGLGTNLVLQLVEVARQRRAQIAFLEVRKSNDAAQRVYSRLGFNEIGVRSDYYPARRGREDAVILAKGL
ncbi:MAG: ribosomal protein S18-alanine N-acetyltransferase [Gammaproteobacteria bacterium]|nr:ribosomal protein S18-alanine N-acetyltransferase [Gammaproteobacteria bacterium]